MFGAGAVFRDTGNALPLSIVSAGFLAVFYSRMASNAAP